MTVKPCNGPAAGVHRLDSTFFYSFWHVLCLVCFPR